MRVRHCRVEAGGAGMSEPTFSAALAAFKRSACCCGEVDEAGACAAPACTFGDVCRALSRGEAAERERDEALAREARLQEAAKRALCNPPVERDAGEWHEEGLQVLGEALIASEQAPPSAAMADLRARVLEEARERILAHQH